MCLGNRNQQLGQRMQCPSTGITSATSISALHGNLLAQVIAKLQREQTSATLITPWWPTAIWFPVLKNLAQPRPLQIPRSMVLPLPGYDASVLQGNPH